MRPKTKTRRATPKKLRHRPAAGLVVTWPNLAIVVGGLMLFFLYRHCEVLLHFEVPVQIGGDVIIAR
jgi:hypothetical protein